MGGYLVDLRTDSNSRYVTTAYGAVPHVWHHHSERARRAYGNPLVLLMLGGFLLATALERSGAHRRIAFFMVRLFGGNSPRRLVLGFMFASAALSMWISNTSTTLMLLPVALAALESTEDKRLATPLLLGIAYAASIGGIGTPIGTPPNMVFMGVYNEISDNAISFGQWMLWALPVVVVLLPLAGFWITRNLTASGAIALPKIGAGAPASAVCLPYSPSPLCFG